MVTVSAEKLKSSHSPAEPWELAVEECLLWEEYQVRTGMRLAVQNLKPLDNPVSYKFTIEETSPVGFMCFMAGVTSIAMVDCHGTHHSIDNRAGDCSLCHLPCSFGESVTHSGQPVQAVGILILPDILRKAAHGRSLGRQSLFTPQGAIRSFLWKGGIPPHVAMTVREVLQCPLKGSMRQVFMEYKAMEMLFSLMSLLDEKSAPLAGVTTVEQSAASRARDIMLASIADPPSLQALAKQVGMTHTRLSAVFQLLFGTTVFGFLREKRLERARRLLNKPRQGIAETAYDCGFSSPGHFTRAFTERYGITPSRYHTESIKLSFDAKDSVRSSK